MLEILYSFLLSNFFIVVILCCVRLFAITWTVAQQDPLFMGFPRQAYWSGLPFPAALVSTVREGSTGCNQASG